MKSAVIIGFGRFGELLADILSQSFDISIIESHQDRIAKIEDSNYRLAGIDEISNYDFIFVAVQINKFEDTIYEIADKLRPEQVVVDVCSVKVYPAKVMRQFITKAQIIATHPLFGPDSAKYGLTGLKAAICNIRCQEVNYQFLCDVWKAHGINVIETTPDEHDQDTAYSQAFTYSIAKVILNMDLPKIEFDTRSYQSITKVAEYSANDSAQLFHDMMYFNPYFPKMLAELKQSIGQTVDTLDDIAVEQNNDQIFS